MMAGNNDHASDEVELREFRYRLINVFADQPFTGTPLAVFPEATGILPESMQSIAQELDRTQTAFVFPPHSPEGLPKVRVFTPRQEIPQCRYPTIGTAFALALEGRGDGSASGYWERGLFESSERERVLFDSDEGQVSVSRFAQVLTVRTPVPELGRIYSDEDAALAALGLDNSAKLPGMPVQAASSGIPFLIVALRNRLALRQICLRRDIWERTIRQFDAPTLLAFTRETERADSTAAIRVFVPDAAPPEDSATEMACGPLAEYMVRYGMASMQSPQLMLFEQGVQLGRPSFLNAIIERDGATVTSVRVGGQCVCVGQGTLRAWAHRPAKPLPIAR